MNAKIGNLLDEVQQGIILQQVNAQGVMGSGIALDIRKRYPKVWEEYSARFSQHPTTAESHSRLGSVLLTSVKPGLYVASIVGQQFFGRQPNQRYTSYDALDLGLSKLRHWLGFNHQEDLSINYPLLGSGLGGGSWPIIKAIISHHLGTLNHNLWLLPGVTEPS